MPDLDQHHQSSLADFELLAEVSQLLTLIDLDRVLERVIELTARAVGATKASLFLHHQHSEAWQRLLITRKLDPQESIHVVNSVVDKGLAGWVMRNRQGTIVYDTETDERWHVFPNDTSRMRSAICLPLVQEEDVLAVITLEHVEPNHFNDHHLRLLTIIANQAAVAIRNAQLFNQMQDQQRQLEATLHAIPDVLLVVNDAGEILLVNDAATALLGDMAQTDVVGRTLDSLIHLDSAFAPLKDLSANAKQEGETWTYDTHSDRQRQDFVVTVSRWANPFSGTAGHVIVMHDMTTLRDLDRFKSEIIKMASHDLRSPLALIVGYCDLIRMETAEESPVLDYLDVVTRSTRRMSGLLEDLLRVEEIRTSPAELHKPIDFAELVSKVTENLHMMADIKHQHVEIDVQLDGLPIMTVDPVLIREAMENLVANAVKYTGEGGTIQVRSYYDDWRVHFVVQDTGMGIPAYDVPHIFEWGFRSKRHSETSIEGKGLGLSLVKSVLDRHRGEVWVESTEGQGSRFGLWLPR